MPELSSVTEDCVQCISRSAICIRQNSLLPEKQNIFSTNNISTQKSKRKCFKHRTQKISYCLWLDCQTAELVSCKTELAGWRAGGQMVSAPTRSIQYLISKLTISTLYKWCCCGSCSCSPLQPKSNSNAASFI